MEIAMMTSQENLRAYQYSMGHIIMKNLIKICTLLRVIIVATLSLACLPVTAISAETAQIRVAMSHWPPWKIIERGEYSGADVAILQAIEKRLAIHFEYVECPWRRCIELVKNGDVDLITSFSRTPDREAFVHYLETAYRAEKIVFYRERDKPFSVRTYADLYKYRIGTLKGTSYFDRFDSDPRLEKMAVALDRQLPQMLFAGRIDLIAGYEKPTDYFIRREGHTNVFVKEPYSVTGVLSHLAMSKKSKQLSLIPELNRAIRRMVENDEIEAIIDRYIEGVEPREP